MKEIDKKIQKEQVSVKPLSICASQNDLEQPQSPGDISANHIVNKELTCNAGTWLNSLQGVLHVPHKFNVLKPKAFQPGFMLKAWIPTAKIQ